MFQKRLIKVPGHVPILFRSFLELPNISQNLDLLIPFLYKNALTIQENDGRVFKTYYFYIYGLPCFVNVGKGRHRTIPKNRLMKFPKSWIRDQYLSKR